MYEYHDAPTAGHPGREKTYVLLTRDFYWNHQYKWVRKYVRACEVCQRVKPAAFSQAPLQSLPTPPECWQPISMDFVFGLPPDSKRRTGVVVFVDRFSKMVHLAAVPAEVTAVQTARLFVDMVFKHHGIPLDIVSGRDPRFTARFWQEVFTLLGTQLSMSTADHPQTDGQAGPAAKKNTSVQGTDSAQARPVAGKNAVLNKPFSTQAMDFVQRRQAVIRFVQDAIAATVDRQKLNADNVGRGNTNEFEKGSLVLLATQNLPRHAVSGFGASSLLRASSVRSQCLNGMATRTRWTYRPACGSIRHSMSGG
ncbi:hypothetical protein PI125_g25736 [Phytophthora idaei]|nr:hypothetical protein PI125_g25736 [Phytophthora idaei]